MKIIEIWDALETDQTFKTGLLLRRYSAHVLPDVYVALRQPAGTRSLAIQIGTHQAVNISKYGTLKDITVSIVPDENENQRNFLLD